MNSDLNGWLTIRVKSNSEERAKENLLNQGFDCYFPSIFTIDEGKKRAIRQPMFPGYGFIKLEADKSLLPVNSTRGVLEIIHFGSYYPIITKSILEGMKSLEQKSSKTPIINIKEGDMVEILKGPLKGLNGIVSNIREKRIEVLFTLLNQSHRAEIDLELISLL